VWVDTFEAEGNFYADTWPLFARGVLGGTDTVTGAGPYVHTIPLLETSPYQPISSSIISYDGYNNYDLVGAQVDTLDLSFTAESDATWKATYMAANTPISGTSRPTSAPSTAAMAPGWDLAVSVGGTGITYVEKFDLKIDRMAKPIYTAGQQNPIVIFSDSINVTGTIDCIVGSNADPFTTGSTAYATTRQSSPLVVLCTITDPATGYYQKFQMSNVQFKDPDRNVGKEYLSYTATWQAIANQTDVSGGGWSPLKFIASNGVSTAYVGS
jgi:Phage tail tube protein